MRGRIAILNGMKFPDYTITRKGTLYSKKIKNLKHVITPTFNKCRQRIVSLYGIIDGKPKKCTTSIHRILAYTYIKKTRDDIRLKRDIVHFKDWDSSNIVLSNLVWVNQFELSLLKRIRQKEETFSKPINFMREYENKFPDIYTTDDIINFYKVFKSTLKRF